MSSAPVFAIPHGAYVGPAYHPGPAPVPVLSGPPLPQYAPILVRPAGQASTGATPQNINAVIEQYDGALKTQKLYTNAALALFGVATVVAVYKHFTCNAKLSRTELDFYKKADQRTALPGYRYQPYDPWAYGR